MVDVDVRVRSPSGTAWTVWVASIILGGELVAEVQRPEVASFFGIPFADSELWPLAAVLGLLALVSTAWVASLYFWPGAVIIQGSPPELVRLNRPFFLPQQVKAPLGECRCTVTFFTEKDEAMGRFKKLVLELPGRPREVLLYGDFRGRERVWPSLLPWRERFAAFEVHIEQGRAASLGRTQDLGRPG